MATFIQESERRFKLIAFNGYKPNGQKRTKSKRITVPAEISKRGILQYVHAEMDAFERLFKYGYSEDAQTTFEEYAKGWLTRQHRYKPTTLATYRSTLERCYEFIGQFKLCDIRPLTVEYLAESLLKRTWRGKPISVFTVKNTLRRSPRCWRMPNETISSHITQYAASIFSVKKKEHNRYPP